MNSKADPTISSTYKYPFYKKEADFIGKDGFLLVKSFLEDGKRALNFNDYNNLKNNAKINYKGGLQLIMFISKELHNAGFNPLTVDQLKMYLAKQFKTQKELTLTQALNIIECSISPVINSSMVKTSLFNLRRIQKSETNREIRHAFTRIIVLFLIFMFGSLIFHETEAATAFFICAGLVFISFLFY
jgi:hypothetical protein